MSDSHNPSILLIDTDLLFAESVAAILRAAHYTVEIAASGRDALDVLTAIEPRHPDLIMLDIALSDIAGTEFCHIVRQHLPSSGNSCPGSPFPVHSI